MRIHLPLLVASLALFSACPTKKKCDVTTCSAGCCDSTGTCQTGDSATACGTGGALCASCAPNACSALRVCATSGNGGGAGSTGGGAGGGGATGGGGGSGNARTVVISVTDHLVNETSSADVNRLGDAGIALFLVNGSTYTELTGTRTADRYTVANVPPGPYVVRYGSSSFYVASTDALDLGRTDLGRADVTLVDAGVSMLTLAVAGLPAWDDGDDLLFFSQGAGFYGGGNVGLTSGPMAGQVPTTFTFDYGKLGYGVRSERVEASKGDSLYVVHLKNQFVVEDVQPGALEDGGTFYLPFTCAVAAGWTKSSSLNVMPGPNALALSFDAGPPLTLGVSYPRNEWVARSSEVHPDAIEYYETLYVSAEPAAGTASADYVFCEQYPDTGWPLTDVNTTFTASNAYPASWNRYAQADVWYFVSQSLPDAGVWTARGSSSARVPVGTPVAPGVHPPTSVSVGGVPGNQIVTASAAAPLLVSWQRSPQAPMATDFQVLLMKITKTNGTTSRTTAAFAQTRDTSFTFPPGLMTPGTVYSVRVRARVTSSTEQKPFATPASSTAEALTYPFLAQ